MKLFFSAPPGALAQAIGRGLEEAGHEFGASKHPGSGAGAGSRARSLVHVSAGFSVIAPEQAPAALSRLGDWLALAGRARVRLERLVLLLPESIYGEGSYVCPVNGPSRVESRREKDLAAARWQHRCAVCGEELAAEPTPETHPAAPLTASGVTALAEERLAAEWARARGIAMLALRVFHMYGARGYDGEADSLEESPADHLIVRAASGLPLELPEDGKQIRDFIHVDDVAAAVAAALNVPIAKATQVVNVGAGRPVSYADFAAAVQPFARGTLRVKLSREYRRGDPRHLFARTDRLRELDLLSPISLREGLQRCFAGFESRPQSAGSGIAPRLTKRSARSGPASSGRKR